MNTNLADIFPAAYRIYFKTAAGREKQVSEIRLRVERPAILMEGNREVFLREDGAYTEHMEQAWHPDRQALQEIVSHLCQYSLYAYEDELRQGYITIEGGHRVNCGTGGAGGRRRHPHYQIYFRHKHPCCPSDSRGGQFGAALYL